MLKLVFFKTNWVIWNQSSYESLRDIGDENLYKWVGSHNQYGAMPIYGKNLKKSSSHLVYSMVYASTTKVVQIMTLG